MAVDILCLTAFVVLLLSRFVLVHNIAAPPRQKHNVFVQGQHVLGRFRMGNFENVLNSFELSDREDRAEAYLRRVITLTGAKQMRNSCVLDVDKTRFHVYVASVSEDHLSRRSERTGRTSRTTTTLNRRSWASCIILFNCDLESFLPRFDR